MSASESAAISDVDTVQVEETTQPQTVETVQAETEETEVPEAIVPPPSINDEEAFPALGSASSSATLSPVSWGPSMSSASTAATSVSSNSASKYNVSRSTNVQEAFHISHLVSLNVGKPELAKIVNDLKKTYSVSIESTLSSITKNRSFIVNGKPNDVIKARKELVRRLTKPVHIRFKVPAKTRSAIIGAGGKNLRPIIESTITKINIERSSTPSGDDEFEEDIEISIEGDVDGVEEAKQSILKIVQEETKHLTSKITVSQKLAPFVQPFDYESDGVSVTGPNKSNVITISGLRENVLSKSAEIKLTLEQLEESLKAENKAIPKKLHKFINAYEILKNFSVVVKIPDADSKEEVVTFLGLPSKVNEAISFARNSTSKFVIEALDISKAHGNNINHARALTAHFASNGILKSIGEEFKTNIVAPSYANLASKDLTSVSIEISGPATDVQAIKSSRKALIQHVNSLPPSRVKFITDIDNLFSKRVVGATESAAKIENVAVIPLNHLSNERTNEIILIALDQEEEDFAPSQEQIDVRLAKVDESLNHIRELQVGLKQVVLDVPSDKQQFIEGPNGTTLKTISASFEHSVLTVKLHSDGKTEASDKIFIQGSKQDVSKVEKEIESLLQDAANVKDIYSFEARTQVPTSVLSRLIGKNGANLNHLSEQFGVNIDVEKNPTGEKAGLTIVGYKFNVNEAEQHIQQAAKRWADETSKTLIVPKKYRSSLIGQNGQYVKRLQTKYNVRINFSQNSDDVIIRGPTRGVTKAESELKDLLDFEIENGYTKEITIPQATVSRVIGRQGETINRIAVDSGIDIRVNSDEKESETRTILLTGSRKGLTEAEKQINAIVKELEDIITIELEVNAKYFREILGARGSRKQEIIEKAGGSDEKDYRRLLQIPEQGSESNILVSTGPKKVVESIISQVRKIIADKDSAVTETLEVSKDKHRLLIGPSGLTRRSLEEEFNIQLSIPKVESNSNAVKVTGLPENVEKAKAKIAELVVDDWKVAIDVPAYLHSAVSERGAFTRKLRTDFNIEVEHGNSSNRAFKLSAEQPAIPKEALGSDEETIKFTIGAVDDDSKKDVSDVIQWRLKGSDEDVKKVEKLIKEAVAKFSKDDTSAYLWVKTPSVFSRVVGPQGSRLNNIRVKSGAQVYVPRNSDKVNNVIYLKGVKDTLEKAEKLLRAEIEKK